MILSVGKKYSSYVSDFGGEPPKNSTSVFRKCTYPGMPVRGRRLTRAFCFVTKSPWISLLGEYTITVVAFSSGARVYIMTSDSIIHLAVIPLSSYVIIYVESFSFINIPLLCCPR